MLAKRAGDEVDGELQTHGYWMALGSKLTVKEMDDLTKLVLDRCKWFPTVAECNEIMAEQTFSNPFYRTSENRRLAGYSSPPVLPRQERWRPDAEEIAAIKREVADSLPNQTNEGE